MTHFEFTILGYGVVQCDDGGDELVDLQNSIAEALIVVYQIKLMSALTKLFASTGTKGQGFAKCSS